ncbi:putative lipase 1 [[Candida] jaroonii]|uniref:Lipase 1 n=1 Tax=[Candida] jaroonii TaxID=467808 RepID=A0ACA9Y7Q7_9ASCO|nr:putative lipase 1 [[Candida] jaroonii]
MKLFWFFLFGIIFASPIKVLTPDEDSFYQPPDNYEDEEPGTILKMRIAPYQIRSLYFPVNVSNVWQVLVKSEDVLGNASLVVSTIFEPYNANSSRLVSYQVAEDSAFGNCAPSYSFVGGGISTIVAKLEMFLIQTALDQGYYVVAPDYETTKSTFTVGPTSGLATLNSIRATLSTGNVTNISPDAEVVMWGYSGGTIASGWAAGLAPTYAEDLTSNLKGCAIGGWVTNITAVAEIIDGSIFVGLTPSAIAGLTNQYPELRSFVEEQILPNKTKSFEKAYELCLADSILNYAFDDIFAGENRYAKNGWDILKAPVIQEILLQNTLGINATEDVKPEIPMFVYHGEKDEIVPYKDSQRVYEVWCDGDGMDSFEFATASSTGHILEVIEGSGAALRWIKKVFDGEELVQGCKKTKRLTNLFYPGAFGEYIDLIKAAIKNIKDDAIGPNTKRSLFDEDFADNFEIQSLIKFLYSIEDERFM